ncbi:MAG: phytoene/squalene synthase family protein [Hyphomicrobiales bacterium]|nr:phytoene/squalene synthase family protein [Hyphomicrobiales bacterium]
MSLQTTNGQPLPPQGLEGAYRYCETLIRDVDKDRYLATLFAAADKRPHVFAIYAFNFEISRIREVVSDSLPGEVRLQWWRDLINGSDHGDVMANPVAAALRHTIAAFNLPREAFAGMIDARIFDLYDDPMPTVADLEGYCGETSSALIRLVSLVLAGGRDPGAADAAGHAGVAYAVTGLMRAFPWHAMNGQVYIPKEYLLHYGATRDDVASGRGGPGVMAALAEMRRLARHHLEQTRQLRNTIVPEIAPAFLPVSLVDAYLAAMEKPGYDPYTSVIQSPQWRRQWTLWRQARRAMH